MKRHYLILDCKKCGKTFKTRLDYCDLCSKCRTLSEFKKPKVVKRKVKKPEITLDQFAAEIKKHNDNSGEILSYGQYQAKRMMGHV